MQMYSKMAKPSLIDNVHSEVIDKIKEISKLREKISNLEEEKENYETIKEKHINEERCNYKKQGNIYDSIVKNKQTSCKDSYLSIGAPHNMESEETKKTPLDDNIISSDTFLVYMPLLEIPLEKVKTIDFGITRNELLITVYDFLINGKRPVIGVIQEKKDMMTMFNFSIRHMDGSGNALYDEKYIGCKITNIFRKSLDYTDDSPSTIQMQITYDAVVYSACS